MKTLFILALLMPAAAIAQEPGRDPNELICRATGEIGTRLARTRTCKTRAQWEELRREQRNSLDRAQTRQVNRNPDETDRGH